MKIEYPGRSDHSRGKSSTAALSRIYRKVKLSLTFIAGPQFELHLIRSAVPFHHLEIAMLEHAQHHLVRRQRLYPHGFQPCCRAMSIIKFTIVLASPCRCKEAAIMMANSVLWLPKSLTRRTTSAIIFLPYSSTSATMVGSWS